MRRPIVALSLSLLLSLIPGGDIKAQSTKTQTVQTPKTQDFIKAPKVRHYLQVRVEGKSISYGVDNAPNGFNALTSNQLFLASSPIKITYPLLNPLTTQVTVSTSEADDPRHSTVAKLIDSLSQFSGAFGSKSAASLRSALAPASCPNIQMVADQVAVLAENEFANTTQPKFLNDQIADWTATAGTGKLGIRGALVNMNKYEGDLKTNIAAAAKAIAAIRDGAVHSPDACTQLAFQALEIAGIEERYQEMVTLSNNVGSLISNLTDHFSKDDQWLTDTEYIVYSYKPQDDKMEVINLKAATVTIKPDPDPSLALNTNDQDTASASLVLAEYSVFAPEVGAGAVISFVEVPQYGTSTNAAKQMVVSLAKTTSTSVDPTLLVNFVCRCASGPFIQPMIQVGVAVSKDLPALLLGGGFRLFSVGKGDIGIGGGASLVWFKDLTKLKVGDVVSGTSDITADLSFNHTPKPVPYVAFQYKF